MLCPELLSQKRYNSLKALADFPIFMANYHQKPLDVEGCLYSGFKTYIALPDNTERIIARVDTADEGSDFLCCIIAHELKGEAYVTDIYYTKDSMEITEPETARRLYNQQVNYCLIESNNGGKGFSRNVEKNLWDKHKSRHTIIDWFHQSANKLARILSNSTFAMNHIYFPADWFTRWPDFYRDIMAFQKEGKNKHDDAPDCLTGLCEMIDTTHRTYVVAPVAIEKNSYWKDN
jgi:predicted phage terminase large subunit-like protein